MRLRLVAVQVMMTPRCLQCPGIPAPSALPQLRSMATAAAELGALPRHSCACTGERAGVQIEETRCWGHRGNLTAGASVGAARHLSLENEVFSKSDSRLSLPAVCLSPPDRLSRSRVP